MRIPRCLLTRLMTLGIFLELFALTPIARAETSACMPIQAVPITISTPGIYCLTNDLNISTIAGAAITIMADNVVLDLNAHLLSAEDREPGVQTYGVYANQRKNITVKNGTIQGFNVGVQLGADQDHTTSRGHVIEYLRVDASAEVGISLQGTSSIIRNNHILTTGPTSVRLGPSISAYAIIVIGSGNRVLNNEVDRVTKQGNGVAHGIFVQDWANFVVGNRIANASTGVEFLDRGTPSSKYRDNLTATVTVPFFGGINAGGNN